MSFGSQTMLTRRAGLIARQRFFLAGALLFAVGLPMLLRIALRWPQPLEPQSWNTLIANTVAVVGSLWLRLSIDQYPGNRASYLLLPSILVCHAANAAFFLFTRIGYDRVVLLAGLLGHLVWAYGLLMAQRRLSRPVIGVVPGGATDRLLAIPQVDWVKIISPHIRDNGNCHALVADFNADLGDDWEGFLADAALDGRIVYQVKQLAESLTGRVQIEHLSENSFGSLVPSRGYHYLKGATEWVGALVLLIVCSPLMIGAAISLLIEGKGPVLFRQQRVGYAGRPFRVIKFRTMVVPNTDDLADHRHAAMTQDDDPRITRVGSVLRRSRIDELPQLFNVLARQMALIGPRPEAMTLSIWYTGEIPFYRYRHVVRPGITGWAQINQGHVAGVDEVHAKLQYDFYYIKYFSPWLDLLIAARTVRTMLTGFGSK